jgi:PKD repeat protein
MPLSQQTTIYPKFWLLLAMLFPGFYLSWTGPLSAQNLDHYWFPVDTLYADFEPQMTRVENHSRVRNQSRAATTNFIVDYTGFTAAQQAAFQYALDLWSAELFSTVPIHIEATMTPLAPGVLGSASAKLVLTGTTGMPVPGAYYPTALRNQYAGCDLLPTEADIIISLNNGINWYLGTDLNPGPTQFDLVSVVLHELGHGLGFFGTAAYDDGIGAVECSGIAGEGCLGLSAFTNFMVYDYFVENGLGTAIISSTNPSAGLGSILTGDDIFWNGANGVGANLGINPKLYAPLSFQAGSSYSHLDEATFAPGDANSLMTPSLAAGEAIHDVGNITRGIMADMGWPLANTPQARFESKKVGYTGLGHVFTDASALASSWAWDFNNDGFTDDISQNPTFVFPGPGSYPVSLTINGVPALTFSQTIEIYDVPVIPFFYDFESSESGFFSSGFSCDQWEWSDGLGKPNYSGFPSLTFGSNSWFTRANGSHGADALYYWETPPINMIGANGDYFLEFDFRGVVSPGAGMNMEYSTNGGSTWQVLGPNGQAEPDALNDWYDSTNVAGLNGENGWAPGPLLAITEFHPTYRINLVKGFGDVRFRLKFGSDATSLFDGFQVDNFEITGNVLDLDEQLVLSGKQTSDRVHRLNWLDRDARPGTRYEVERQSEGSDFLSLAKLAAGSGQNYVFEDHHPFPGVNQYRIRKIGPDGQLSWSNVVELHHSRAERVKIFPNPFQESVHLEWFSTETQALEIKLFSLSGKLLVQQSFSGQGWNQHELPLGHLSAGAYLYEVVGNGFVSRGKLVKSW